ncbi:MAG: sugar porter family MFS transporter [Sphingobacteriales bacterium]|nr:sugar porter family MFS transporter [Sphingobacteriales bacterium]NCT74212.1 sugar porter family MFS transporter [Chitinophagaceae bacterium]OJW34205.1 MAG: MFS transporter [Sphingobacteriales bacterium 46-32]
MNDVTTPKYNSSYIVAISFISALGGYLFGFDFAVIAGALPFLKTMFDLTPVQEGFLTGSLALGCIAGTLLAGSVAEKYGRKPALVSAALIFALSSVGMAFSHSLPVFISMRFAAGVGVGMASVLSPMYIAEISPASVRGRNVSINQLTIVIGILITNLVNYLLADNGPDAWRWMFGLGVVPSLLFFAGIFWLPESPRWLLKAGKKEESAKVLRKIGNEAYASSVTKDITASLINVKKQSWRMLLDKAVFPALAVGIGLAMFQQLCGINIIFNYASTIFASVGAGIDQQLLGTVGIGVVNLIFTLVAMWQVDKLGRRPLMLMGSIGLTVLYIILALALKAQMSTAWIAVFVFLAIGMYATSLAPVTWVLISEIFPNKVRAMATSMAVVFLWIGYFILTFTFPILIEAMGSTYSPFILYAVICLIGFFFVKTKVKETKGRTLEELEQVMTGH